MNSFEERFPKADNLRGYVLISSLEPCPMCLARLLITGIETVKYVARDELGGMVSGLDKLPPAWSRLAQRQEFVLADVRREMREVALEIFLINLNQLRKRLWAR